MNVCLKIKMNISEYVNCKLEVSNLSIGSTNHLNNSTESSFRDSSTNSSIETSSSGFNINTDNSYASPGSGSSSCSSCRICSNISPLTKTQTTKKKDRQIDELKTELNDLISNLKTDLNLNFSHLNYEQALLNAKLSTIQCYLKVVYNINNKILS